MPSIAQQWKMDGRKKGNTIERMREMCEGEGKQRKK